MTDRNPIELNLPDTFSGSPGRFVTPRPEEHYFSEYDNPKSVKDRLNGWDNRGFRYPSRVDRTPANETFIVRRGFMRALHGESNTEASVRNARLNFQFNPGTIQRSVAGRHDVHMMLNTTPVDALTPLMGNSNFTLELLFNREAEVAAETDKVLNLDVIRSADTNLAQFAGKIGVLADVFVMDAIIGQGMNQASVAAWMERVEYMQTYASDGAGTGTSDATGPRMVNPSDRPKDEQTGDPLAPPANVLGDDVETQLKTMFEGNTAYLIPQPVRLIFSDLFMVDGLVLQSSVAFTKFSRRMVPTVAAVGLQIQAFYIGFHREKTMLTRMWNAAFQKPAGSVGGGSFGDGSWGGGAFTSSPLDLPAGTVSTIAPNQGAAIQAIQDRMRTTGFFQRVHHARNAKFTDFAVVGGTSPMEMALNVNWQWQATTGTVAVLTEGYEVRSFCEVIHFQYQNDQGTWVDVGNKLAVDPVVVSTQRKDTYQVIGMQEHKIRVWPKLAVLQYGTRLRSDLKYRMKFHLTYQVGFAGTFVQSNKTVVNVVKNGNEQWNLAPITVRN